MDYKITLGLMAFSTLVLVLLPGISEATGYVKVRPLAFHNSHALDSAGRACDYHESGCDHYFKFCLTGYNAGGCSYGTRTTTHAENSFLVDFTSGSVGVTSFRFNFNHYPGSFKLVVDTYDDDGSSSLNPDDHVDTTVIQKIMSPGQTSSGEYYGNRAQSGDRRTRLNVEFTVGCDAHYYGSRCDIFCEPQDDVDGHYTCGTQGQKICRSGWTEPFTNCITPVCTPACEQGRCTAPNTCSCEAGYQGNLCQSPICAVGCNNGWCSIPGECRCNPGYSGHLCTIDERFCERQNPCTNNGTCRDVGPNQYQCDCPYGYNGTNCNSTYDVCSVPDFCANGGSCTPLGGVGQFECSCPMGYTGERCQDLVDNCVSGVCLNGGECINALNSFSCHCVPGFTGGFCDVNIDECASNPCHNRGICIDEVNDFYCVCPPSDGSPPKDCSGSPCLYHKCENDGLCVVEGDKAVCNCKPDFVGEYCAWNKTKFDEIKASDQPLSDNELIYIGVGCGAGGIVLCFLCLAWILCCVVCWRKRSYKHDVEEADYNTEDDSVTVATKIKQMEINNPKYETTPINEGMHLYDHVSTIRRENPYEEVPQDKFPVGYSTLNSSPYGNTSPTSNKTDHTYPEVGGKRVVYDTPKKVSPSSPLPQSSGNIPSES